MGTASSPLRIAAIQAAPVFLDRQATLDKAVQLIREAAMSGARLIAFGEGFLPGHPVWFHLLPITHPSSIAMTTELLSGAISIPGPEIDELAAEAKRARAVVVMGVVERPDPGASVLHDTAVVMLPDGSVERRRKIVPAVGERIVYAAGSGEDIRIVDTPWGPMSALLGGENTNPLLTAACRAMGARLHVAMWPPHFNKPGLMPQLMAITGQAIAYQNTAWVLAVAGATSDAAIGRLATSPEQRVLLEAAQRDAASLVVAPRGGRHAGPQAGGDGILYADIDLADGAWANLVNRHYDRPDLLRLVIDRRAPGQALTVVGDDRAASAEAADRLGRPGMAPVMAVRDEILERLGDRISAADVDELVPYVQGIRALGAQLLDLDLEGSDG